MILLLALHFLADFIFQSREMGSKKSSEWKWLARHITIVFLVFLIGTLSWKFALANAAIHALIDAFIWKGYAWSVWIRRKEWTKDNESIVSARVAKAGGISREIRDNELKECLKTYYKYWEDYWFYITIGLDQLLHISTIVLLLGLL